MRRRWILFLAALVLASPVGAAKKPPHALAWIFDALENEVSSIENAPAVTLLDEAQVQLVGSGGKRHYRRRTVVRILTADGRDLSLQPIYYGQNSSLVAFKAWTIRPDGSIEEFAHKDAVDFSMSDAAVYSDARARVLWLRNVGVGSSVAVEFTREEDRFFLQDEWWFQDDRPVALSRYQVTLPPGWTYEAKLLNHAPVEPTVDGQTLTWEMRDLPGLKPEPEAAPLADQVARLTLSFLPRGGASAEDFRSWADVAAWYQELATGQAVSDEEMRKTVATLTQDATTELEKIRKIGRFVQDLRYVSINLGLSAYQPHRSPEVFQNRYADCKDKATLMMAMLKVAGITSHHLLVDTRDSGKVFEEFPSPMQFNHCIIAIPVPEKTVEHPLVIDPDMGDILVFDPTDDLTPVGDLPWTDQGTQALLVDSEHGGLVSLPVLPAGKNLCERSWDVVLDKDGHARVSLEATFHGQYGRMMRGRYGRLDNAERIAELTRWVSHSVPGARVEKLEFGQLDDQDRPLVVTASLEVSNFARRAGALLLAEPFRLIRTMSPDMTEDDRKRPVFVPFLFEEQDRVALTLPDGYRVSEPPPDASGDAAIGSFRVEHHAAEGGWQAERTLIVDTLEIEPAGYADAREFLRKAGNAATAVLVLEKP